ncbi:hypothetical protein OH76DRAFT_309994 [Lentinus brumalis]|uniref:Uncharacterized protein n=1 Tax=Lentinus brumalis TaxID=2498619 RepID=A0A371CK95_9APHY|nr:hypothetical protein OH76DRAFT_309994 [Polyporus brumalis]
MSRRRRTLLRQVASALRLAGFAWPGVIYTYSARQHGRQPDTAEEAQRVECVVAPPAARIGRARGLLTTHDAENRREREHGSRSLLRCSLLYDGGSDASCSWTCMRRGTQSYPDGALSGTQEMPKQQERRATAQLRVQMFRASPGGITADQGSATS